MMFVLILSNELDKAEPHTSKIMLVCSGFTPLWRLLTTIPRSLLEMKFDGEVPLTESMCYKINKNKALPLSRRSTPIAQIILK